MMRERLLYVFASLLLFGFVFHQTMAILSNELHGTDSTPQCCFSNPLACSINDFGASLLKEIPNQQNVFISTVGIYVTLAMTYLGARGETAQQMERALQLSPDDFPNQTEFHTNLKIFVEALRYHSTDSSFLTANGVFIQQNVSINEQYTNDVWNFYEAFAKVVNFADEPELTKETVNRFVAENTGNKISEFLQEPLDLNTVMTLLNAVYFKGLWEREFPENQTNSGIFHISPCQVKSVDMMIVYNQMSFFFRNRTTGDKFLELPYKNSNMSMLLFLPGSMRQSELIMNSELLCKVKQNLLNAELGVVAVPKFQLRYKQELKSILVQLGLEDIFTDSADLGGMSSERDIKISSILHEAAIDVNEQGSEAASVTNDVIIPESLSLNQFVANSPFSFYIIDNANGIILFSGHVHNP